MRAMARLSASVTLRFDKDTLTVGEDATDIRDGLSAVVLSEDRLWLACDEGCRIERLSRSDDAATFDSHEVFPLGDLLKLPAPATDEADIEGMDVDDGYLWIVGSHSVKRKKAKAGDSPDDVVKKLASTKREGNRHLLARLPLKGSNLEKAAGARTAAMLPATTSSSALLDAVRSPGDPRKADPHLAAFIPLPGKDNGFDIEGLAVVDSRAYIGLRGPVLREWCCVLECRIDVDREHLALRENAEGALYRKHFLKLNGLGVRDLIAHDDDLLILAGPTMGHDGPAEIWRWKQGARPDATVSMGDVERELALPQGVGVDRPEGMTLYESGRRPAVLVVYDTPAKDRRAGKSGVKADLFRLS
jgi:hypothetical protein